MVRVLEAVYEDGVLKPLADPGLADRQRVVLEIQLPAEQDAASSLREWQRVYEGLSEQDISEVEAVALDRSRFSRRQP
jgi:predicted DNA-binding antitoxin AbrB/MazE fold protein